MARPFFTSIGSYPIVYVSSDGELRCGDHADVNDTDVGWFEGDPIECEYDGCEYVIHPAYTEE